MKRHETSFDAYVLMVAGLCIFSSATPAVADPINVIFTIDPTQSTQTLAATSNANGSLIAQSPNSLTTSVSGNFVVSFDPSTDNPQSIQIAGSNPSNNNGFFQDAMSVPSASPFGTPANLAIQSTGGQEAYAYRNLVYNLNSPVLTVTNTSGLSETFTAATTSFVVTGGSVGILGPPAPNGATVSELNARGTLTTGTWTLTESGVGTGLWTLTQSSTYTSPYNISDSLGTSSGTSTFTQSFVATATVQTAGPNANVASVATPTTTPVTANALGGSATTGGVSATFNPGTTGGTLAVQQVPGMTSLTQAAVGAAQSNPEFLLTTSNQAIGTPQIWNVQFDGSLNGGLATLVFDYDPNSLPAGTDQSQLGIWHYNELVGQWQFGGTVDVADHTITFVTPSFSPFELGRVPEPSTIVLALCGLLPLSCARWWKRRNFFAN
jgi:hypothetical protein